ncbi:MAG: hypothetical protein ABL983_00125 [Nitrospira sp.]
MSIVTPVPQSIPRSSPDHASVEIPMTGDSTSDTRLRVTTPRAQALAILTRELQRGEIVTIGSTVLRVLEQGEQVEEGSLCFEARQGGLFQRLAVYTHGQSLDGPPSHYTWGYGLDLGQADHWIGALYDTLTPYEREVLVVTITTRHVLHEVRTSRGITR